MPKFTEVDVESAKALLQPLRPDRGTRGSGLRSEDVDADAAHPTEVNRNNIIAAENTGRRVSAEALKDIEKLEADL